VGELKRNNVGHKCPVSHRCTQVCEYSLEMPKVLWKMLGFPKGKNEDK
jgi:hypothetical protein